MKSILQEASSVCYAIQKAWEDAGKPSEFTVKVLEQGQKKFLWFTQKPAVVSLTFEPQTGNRAESHKANDRRNPKHKEAQQKNQHHVKRDRRRVDELGLEEKNHAEKERLEQPKRHATYQAPQKEVARPLRDHKEHAHKEQALKESHNSFSSDVQKSGDGVDIKWTPEYMTTIKGWLDEILGIMNIAVPFTFKEDQRTLLINFESKVLEREEDEGMLFSSFSYLLLQSLKKKNKNKFKGFRIHLKAHR